MSDEDVKRARKRHAKLRALLAADRFTELQKQVPDEIAYLQSDTQRRLSEAASKAASTRLYGSRLADLAQQCWKRSATRAKAAVRKRSSASLKRWFKRMEQIIRARGDSARAGSGLGDGRRSGGA